MPPRYAYWTILVDGQPTAFRSGSLEDIMPTFNRLKEKQPTVELKWFQNGQLWPSRNDAQESMRARGARGREKDPRQGSDNAASERAWNAKPDWKTRSSFSAKASARPASRDEKPEWKPKGTFKPAEAGHRAGAGDKPTWTPKGSVPEGRPFTGRRDEKPAWSPKGGKPAWTPASAKASARPASRDEKPEWKPKGTFKPKEAGHSTGWGEKPAFAKASAGQARSGGKPDWKPKGSPREQARATFRPKSYTPKGDVPEGRPSTGRQSDRPTWTPKGAARPGGPNAGFAKSESGETPKRKWVPKAEYKKSLGLEVKRDDKWRPGGEHVDPKQKYKDAKKAKWTRVKATIRARSTGTPRKREE